MCGISGKIFLQSGEKVTAKEISQMTNALAHRGPDSSNTKIIKNAALGHNRLSIIDLSTRSNQPMSDGNYTVTFNGEIYNFQEIKNTLIKRGIRFKTTGDTEVILKAYQEYGVDCLNYFRGMYAFAIYDKKNNTLFAARDRLGKKPFKYYFDNKTFIFASEIKAILTQKEVKKEIDPEAINQYIYWGFIPSPKTGFKNIYKLPPAHYLLLKNNKLQIKKYWDYELNINHQRSEQETVKELRNMIEESVQLRMVSDVPIGAFLSGGIDSTIIVGLMAKLAKTKVNTYTIGFKDWTENETELAKITAKKFNTKHQQFIIKPDINDILPKIVNAYDEPFGDVSAIPSYYVSSMAAKKVKVVLNGDGGDENFLGYSNYQTFLIAKKLKPLSMVAQLIYKTLKPFKTKLLKNNSYQRILRISHILGNNPLINYQLYSRGYLNIFLLEDLLLDKKFNPVDQLTKYLPKKYSNEIDAILYADLQNVLPEGLMTKMDIASMQCGLETRSPLLDHKLIEFAATIPSSLKYKNGTTKYILRKAFSDLIPDTINKQPKRGFVMPVNKWFKKELKKLLETEFSDQKNPIYKFVDFNIVQKMIQLHQESTIDYAPIIWKLLMLSLWFKKYIYAKN